jgi:hypothetical protein
MSEKKKRRRPTTVPHSEWRWFGDAGHFICGAWCRFHLATQIGDVLVSTVGRYFPTSKPEVAIPKDGEEIGWGRRYETMAFKVTGKLCDCGCGIPTIIPSEIEFDGYNNAKAHDALARAFEEMAERVRRARDETGLRLMTTKPCDSLRGVCDDYPVCVCGRASKQKDMADIRVIRDGFATNAKTLSDSDQVSEVSGDAQKAVDVLEGK